MLGSQSGAADDHEPIDSTRTFGGERGDERSVGVPDDRDVRARSDRQRGEEPAKRVRSSAGRGGRRRLVEMEHVAETRWSVVPEPRDDGGVRAGRGVQASGPFDLYVEVVERRTDTADEHGHVTGRSNVSDRDHLVSTTGVEQHHGFGGACRPSAG